MDTSAIFSFNNMELNFKNKNLEQETLFVLRYHINKLEWLQITL